jgi:hypothetical protein
MGTCRLRIVPNAKRSQVAGEHGGAIRIKIAAPAVEGKANAALIGFLAGKLGIHTRAISLVSGEKSRDKVVELAGLDGTEARRRLLET